VGWTIVRHSFVLLFRNLGDALKVSIGPMIVGILVVVATLALVGFPWDALRQAIETGRPVEIDNPSAGFFLSFLVALLTFLFVFGWVAVSWHRFVLLEEYPGLLPGTRGKPIWSYVGRSILLGLLLVLCMIPVVLVASFLGVFPTANPGQLPSPTTIILLNLILGTVGGWLWLRFALVLPGTALGNPMSLGDGWRAGARLSGAILQAAFILVVLNVAISLTLGLLLGPGLGSTLLTLFVNWVTFMGGISILTTLYGHLIEGRSID
jgi:hypothetical protein